MDFDKVKRYDLDQGRGWTADSATLEATEFDGDWVRSEDFDACHAELIVTCWALENLCKELTAAGLLESMDSYSKPEKWISEARTELEHSTTEEN